MFYEFQHAGPLEYTKKYVGENLDFPSHLHQSFELIITLSGKMEVMIDREKITLEKGDAALVFPYQIHSLVDFDSKHLLYIFSPETVKAFSANIIGKIPKNNKFTPSNELICEFEGIADNAPIFEKKGLLYTLCSQFNKKAEYAERKNEDKNSLIRIFDYVEKNFTKDCSLESVSKALGFSYSYLSRSFKKAVGISFNNYVNRYRITKACYMLLYTNASILQCALDSGYSSLRSFNRNFAQIHILSPVEYRNTKRSTT